MEENNSIKRQSENRNIFIAVSVVVILAIAPLALVFFGFIGEKKSSDLISSTNSEEAEVYIAQNEHSSDIVKSGGAAKGSDVTDEDLPEGIVFYDIKEFEVNLKQDDSIKMSVTFELPDESYVKDIEFNMPEIRNSFRLYLQDLERSDLQKSEGIFKLREELLSRVNKITGPSKVNDILFKEVSFQ